MTQRRASLIVAGLCCILVPSLGMLAVAYYNRAKPPSSALQLTERELRLPATADTGDSAALTFGLIWRVEGMGHGDFATQQPSSTPVRWMTPEKAAALGVKSVRDLRWRASVPAFLVLEFNGHSYAQELRRACRTVESAECARVRGIESRLYVIDAGTDPQVLRQEYPDPAVYAIVHGTVTFAAREDATLAATIGSLDVETVQAIEPLRSRRVRPSGEMSWRALRQEKSFIAEIAFGRRYEPWNTAVSCGPHATPPPIDLPRYRDGGAVEINPD